MTVLPPSASSSSISFFDFASRPPPLLAEEYVKILGLRRLLFLLFVLFSLLFGECLSVPATVEYDSLLDWLIADSYLFETIFELGIILLWCATERDRNCFSGLAADLETYEDAGTAKDAEYISYDPIYWEDTA